MSESKNPWIGRTGGCLCGANRYEIVGAPLALIACHCTDCQRRGGGAISLSMPLMDASLRTLQGTLIKYEERIAERTKTSEICGACHTRLTVRNTATPGMVILKAGTLDDCSDLRPVAHAWVRSKQPWVTLDPACLTFDEQPTPSDFGAIAQAWAAQR